MKPCATGLRRAPAMAATCAALACAGNLHAQPASTSGSPSVVVTGNPLGSERVAAPTSVLSGEGLVLRRGTTLGETLDGLPGVSSSWFGPNANRPVIRGQDGDRVRMLVNSGVPLDVSGLSSDHAVPIDPLVVERVEVLRGPAALLYGGAAVGGVVNAIDNRIPKAAVDQPTGAAELRYGGPAAERGTGAWVEAGGNGLAVHADGFWRTTDDVRTPWFPRPDEGGGSTPSQIIVNSASRSHGGALGASKVWDSGYLGAAVDTYRSSYGVVAEPGVTIDMVLDKLTLAGEARDLDGWVRAVSGHWLVSNYRHQEVEGSGEVATTFKNKGSELRLQAEHATLFAGGGSLSGIFGLQTENADFSALGEEAFVPNTTTRQFALFALEELKYAPGSVSLGGRIGHVSVGSDGDAPGQSQFGPAQSRRFTPYSVALGGVLDLAPQWQASASLAYTVRAPTFYELYANGLHVATGAYEVGNPDMAAEKGSNLDLALQWQQGANKARAGVFGADFSNYIALLATGQHVDTDEGPVPVYAFTGVPARLWGIELEGSWRVRDDAHQLDLYGRMDMMRAENEASGQPMPRIPPARVTAGVTWRWGNWGATAEATFAAAQDRVPTDDPPTPAYTIVNLRASYAVRWRDLDGLLFLRLNNVGNELAYNATTIATVRPLAPLPGRGLMAGLRLNF